MFKKFKLTYFLLITVVGLVSCNALKHVPKGHYLVHKNKLKLSNSILSEDEITEFIRQKPNSKLLGINFKLWVFNHIDSSKVSQKRTRQNQKLIEINQKRTAKENRINAKRIAKAEKKGDRLYKKKIIELKDVNEPRLFFREWAKYKYGEVPVVFDSILYEKSIEQIQLFAKKKGYLKAKVEGNVEFTKRFRVNITYDITPNELYVIDSVRVNCTNGSVLSSFNAFVAKDEANQLKNKPFDRDLLEDYRNKVAKYMRDDAFYGFSPSHIKFVDVDTFTVKNKVSLEIKFLDRMIRLEQNRDSLVPKAHAVTTVQKVYFHYADTSDFKGNFKKTIEDLGFTLIEQNYLRTIDTFQYQQIKVKGTTELDPKRMATFLYNGELFLNPRIMEAQNFLEEGNYYKEKYVDRSYSFIQQLGLFQNVKIITLEVPKTDMIDVHYFLIPSKKQSFSLIPRGSTSNGFLGISSSINYINKNLFKGAEKLTLAISGGLESQPPVFEKNSNGDIISKSTRSLNTFEIGPSAKLELIGLYPIKATQLYKRQRARTVISAAYNYQNRADFSREIFQMNYTWRFLSPNKAQVFQVGLPFLSVIKFVNIVKSTNFQSQLDNLNDLFLRNTYSDQFIWQDFKFTFEFKNTEKEKRARTTVYFTSSLDVAGNTLKAFRKYQEKNEVGQYLMRGLVYAQFMRLDNQITLSHPLSKNRSVHFKTVAGGGLPYGNTSTSMPYDYSFFAGGSNDNRGWKARTLGPGGYKYYLDTNMIQTQVSDLRLGGTVEYRFSISSSLKGAFFVDAGNIWTIHNDSNRLGSQFNANWYKQIAVAAGIGLRIDLDFFIIRLDVGLPIHNPAFPKGSNWIFQSLESYHDEVNEKVGNYPAVKLAAIHSQGRRSYSPALQFGIGYPF